MMLDHISDAQTGGYFAEHNEWDDTLNDLSQQEFDTHIVPAMVDVLQQIATTDMMRSAIRWSIRGCNINTNSVSVFVFD